MSQSAELNQTISRIHWTARAGFYLSLVATLFGFLSSWIALTPAYLSYYGLSPLAIPALILSCIALVLSRQPVWRRGREFAMIGLVLGMIMTLYLAALFSFQCCFHFHFVF